MDICRLHKSRTRMMIWFGKLAHVIMMPILGTSVRTAEFFSAPDRHDASPDGSKTFTTKE